MPVINIQKITLHSWRVVGVLGTLACLGIFVRSPSFPTPDKLVVFLTFIFMMFGQARDMLKRLLPFVALLLVYESFRGIAHRLNDHVNFTLAPSFDKAIFGRLPTSTFQQWLWKGHTSWYDVALYIPYMAFFVIPIGFALLIWKTHEKHYWSVVTTYLMLFFSAFLTFLLFPAAPPWMASQKGIIEPISWVSINIWGSIGFHDFPTIYHHIAPNPVAAVPSLHVGVSTLTSLLIFKYFGRRWGLVGLLYPFSIYFGVVYLGEHYVFDVVAGIAYSVIVFLASPKLVLLVGRYFKGFSSSTRIGLKSER